MKNYTFLLVFIALFSWQANAQITTYPYAEDFEGGAADLAVTGTGTCGDFNSYTDLGYTDSNPWSCVSTNPAEIELCGLTADDTIWF